MKTTDNAVRILAATGLLVAGSSVAAQEVAAGKRVFEQCAACHSVDGSNGVGPSLKGVVGRKSASSPGFRYSSAMQRAGIVWHDQVLDDYVADPQKVVPGNVMPYSGIADAKQRKDLIAYLKTLR
jgi:cytochrome c